MLIIKDSEDRGSCTNANPEMYFDDIVGCTPEMVDYVNIFPMSLCKKYSQQKLKLNSEHASHDKSTLGRIRDR